MRRTSATYQSRYFNHLDAQYSHECRYILRTAPVSPALDCADLLALFAAGDKQAAYGRLATLTAPQLALQAEVYAAYVNDAKGLTCNDTGALNGGVVLARWNKRMAQEDVELRRA